MKLENLTERKEEVEYEIYVDLDGVLADIQAYVEKVLGRKLETLPNGNWAGDEEIWDELHAKNEPQFDKMQKMPDAMKLWEYIRKYKPNILSATGTPEDRNRKLKEKWVRRNLSGYNQVILVKKSVDKAQLARPNRILIDDRNKSTYPWSKAGGIAIQHTDAESTIAKLKELGL